MEVNNKKIRTIIVISAIIVFYLTLLLFLVSVESKDGSINNFPISLWYFIVTLSSVGYGDVYPITTMGKVIGSVFVLTSIIFLSMVVSSITNYFIKQREKKKMGYNGTNFENHSIILGWDNFAKYIVDILAEAGRKVAIIVNDKEEIDKIYERYGEKNIFCLFTDYNNYDTFKKVNIEKCHNIFINTGSDTDKLITILNLKKKYNNINYIVILENSQLKDTFTTVGVTFVLSKDEIASRLMASYIFEPDVANFNLEILSGVGEDNLDVQQYKVLESNPYIHKDCDFIASELKKIGKCLLVGISKRQPDGTHKLIKLPDSSVKADVGDYLLFIVNESAQNKLKEIFKTNQGL